MKGLEKIPEDVLVKVISKHAKILREHPFGELKKYDVKTMLKNPLWGLMMGLQEAWERADDLGDMTLRKQIFYDIKRMIDDIKLMTDSSDELRGLGHCVSVYRWVESLEEGRDS